MESWLLTGQPPLMEILSPMHHGAHIPLGSSTMPDAWLLSLHCALDVMLPSQ